MVSISVHHSMWYERFESSATSLLRLPRYTSLWSCTNREEYIRSCKVFGLAELLF